MRIEILEAPTFYLPLSVCGDVSRQDAARALGVSVGTMANYERRGWLTKTKRFGCVWYPAEQIKRLAGIA